MGAIRSSLEKKTQTMLGDNGQLIQEMDDILQRKKVSDESGIILLLNTLSQGRRKVFDSKTHRQVQQVFARFSYIYLVAKMVADMEPTQIEDAVLTHLEFARDAIRKAWGETEWTRMVQNLEVPKLVDLPQITAAMQLTDGNKISSDRMDIKLSELNEMEKQVVVNELGKRTQTQIYRQVLLGAITELWVEYLTSVEALRISIGLEAYAQRDPLVQYKGKASQLFQDLLSEIRSAVISRMFLYSPRTQVVRQAEAVKTNQPQSQEASPVAKKSRRKRRRRH
jgi:preprotein translocase subunit SecA